MRCPWCFDSGVGREAEYCRGVSPPSPPESDAHADADAPAPAPRPRTLRRRSCGLTDVGKKRPHNEDAFLADDTLGLYVVADGVGGLAKGEVASSEAVDEVRNFVCSGYAAIDGWLRNAHPGDEERIALCRLLESAVQSACYLVYALAEQDPEGQGMSTTVSALLLVGDQAIVAQVGDSRVYRLRAGSLLQVTDDHTLVNHKLKTGQVTAEEARTMKGRNLITRAVGHHDYVEVDVFALPVEVGDRFLICSDGLHGYFKGSEAVALLAAPSVEAAARRAVELANERGGRDNVTALVVAVA